MSGPSDDFVDPGRHLADPESRYGFSGGDILHPSDMSVDEGRAFAHALALALRLQARLSILHAGSTGEAVDVDAFPHVRETLIRWGMLEPGATQEDVFDELGVEVKKIRRSGGPIAAIEHHLEHRATDMIVLATRGAGSLPKWLGQSVSQHVVRTARTRMLFVPRDGRGFVSVDDGSLHVRCVLVPLARDPDPRFALLTASRIAQVLGQVDVEFVAVHVGDERTRPALDLPEPTPLGRWTWAERSGPVAKTLAALADERGADLIAMVTEGTHGLLESLGGSTAAQVLRLAPCPLLATPAHLFVR